MLTKRQILLRTPEPKDDESFLGYVIRLAEQNGYENPSWILSLTNIPKGTLYPGYSFLPITSEPFQLLTTLSGSTATKLSSLNYQPVGEWYTHIYQFFGLPVHRSFIRPAHPKVCPACLREASYCRRIWEYALITACPVHQCMLVDECPHCKRHIRWSRKEVSNCPCKFDWRETPTSSVQEYELNLARVIYRLCGLPCGESKSYVSSQNPALRLSLHDLTQAVIFMAGQLHGHSLTTGWPLLSSRRVKDLHKLFVGAYYIFDDWPNHLYEFLHWWRVQEKSSFPTYQRLRSVLYKDFDKLYFGLYKILADSQFDFIRSAFVDYLHEEWEGYDLSLFTGKKSTGRYRKVKYVSKSDARRLLDADDEWINHNIRTGRLKTKVLSKGMKRLIFIDVMDVAKLTRVGS